MSRLTATLLHPEGAQVHTLWFGTESIFSAPEDSPPDNSSELVMFPIVSGRISLCEVTADISNNTTAKGKVHRCYAKFSTECDAPVFLASNTYFHFYKNEAGRDIIQLLKGTHFARLQRFCRSGVPDDPFHQLRVSASDWDNADSSGPGCRDRMVDRIVRAHIRNGGSFPCPHPNPSNSTIRTTKITAAVKAHVKDKYEGIHPRLDGNVSFEVVCSPKPGATVVPLLLTIQQQCVFRFDRSRELEASLQQQRVGYIAGGRCQPPETGRVEVVFEYCKVDTVTMEVRVSTKKTVLDARKANHYALSESSRLRFWKCEAPSLHPQIEERATIQSPPSLGVYIQSICALSTVELEQRCRTAEGDTYLSVKEWNSCWTCGTGCRRNMIYAVARCLLKKHKDDPMLLYIVDYDEKDADAVGRYLRMLADVDRHTLKAACMSGGAVLAGADVLKMNSQQWRNCLRSGKVSRDEMARAISRSIDDRIYRNIRVHGNVVEGFLDGTPEG